MAAAIRCSSSGKKDSFDGTHGPRQAYVPSSTYKGQLHCGRTPAFAAHTSAELALTTTGVPHFMHETEL
jgi:hypothetical protein